jgi:hypothetical protein
VVVIGLVVKSFFLTYDVSCSVSAYISSTAASASISTSAPSSTSCKDTCFLLSKVHRKLISYGDYLLDYGYKFLVNCSSSRLNSKGDRESAALGVRRGEFGV